MVRNQRVSLGLAVAAAISCGIWLVLSQGLAPEIQPVPTVSNDEFVIDNNEFEISAPAPQVVRTELLRGQTLTQALRELGIEEAEIPRLLASVAERLDLRRLPAGTGLSATEGRTQIGIRTKPAEFVRITRSPTGWTSETVSLPIQTSIETTGGRLDTSVSQAFSQAVEAQGLVLAYADIFQWDVDLLIDPRPGDLVRAVYEVRRFGSLPGNLPRFRGKATFEGDVVGLGRILAANYEGTRTSSAAFWVEHAPDSGAYYDEDGQPLRKAFLKNPLNYRRISSGFSRARKHPVTGRVRPHYGVDFAAPRGTPVAATADGVVIGAGTMGGLGRAVKIRHTSGYTTAYGHFSRIAAGIRNGVRVEQNQVIGYVGSTGLANGPHLHYTMYENGKPIDPLRFKNQPAKPLPDDARPQLLSTTRRWAPVLASIPVEVSSVAVARMASSADPSDSGG